jgi:hypothetical protein
MNASFITYKVRRRRFLPWSSFCSFLGAFALRNFTFLSPHHLENPTGVLSSVALNISIHSPVLPGWKHPAFRKLLHCADFVADKLRSKTAWRRCAKLVWWMRSSNLWKIEDLRTKFQALVLILFCERGRRGLSKIAMIFERIAVHSH